MLKSIALFLQFRIMSYADGMPFSRYYLFNPIWLPDGLVLHLKWREVTKGRLGLGEQRKILDIANIIDIIDMSIIL